MNASKIFEGIDESLKPIYSTTLNQAICLFDGDLELFQQAKSLSTIGSIEFEWLPSPSANFRLPTIIDITYANIPDLSPASLKISTFDHISNVMVTNSNIGENISCQGFLCEPIIIGDHSSCEKVVFHLPNFKNYHGKVIRDLSACWAGRLSLRNDEWEVVLDQNKDARALIENIAKVGGFALTHTGVIKRNDRKRFSLEQAQDIIMALHFFLSFVRGIWCGPILAVGLMDEKIIWQKWDNAPRLTPWKSVSSWFNNLEPDKIDQAFKGFMTKWDDEFWRDPIKQAIHWYIVSNLGAGGLEGSIVLTQTALELLSWVCLVEEPDMCKPCKKEFEKIHADEKIRSLLRKLEIPIEIPVVLSNLRMEHAEDRNADGPKAIVNLRNAIVHSRKKKREHVAQLSLETKLEAHEMGLWYVEMVLLHIFGYNGSYYLRFLSGWPNEVEAQVPWAKTMQL